MTTGKLTLQGWKGIATEIELRPMTFLVGPNGSGKSSILESLALVSHLARRGTLREDLRPWLRGWPDGVFTRSGGKVATEASLELEWGRSRYRIAFERPRRPQIRDESLRVGQRTYVRTREGGIRSFTGEGAGRGLETDNPYESALALIARSPKRRKRAQVMIDLITRIEIYALDADFLRGTVQDPRPLPYARKGTGLVAGLIDARRNKKVWNAVIAALRAIQPDLDEIDVREKPRGAIVRYLDERETELDEESDGFVRAAGMFLVRYRPECPAILGFDEPENGYHLSRLVDVVARLAPARGAEGPDLVLLATHSPSLVQKAVRTLKAHVGVVSLWRSGAGQVMVRQWAGEELQSADDFDSMVAEAFEGR
jgi:predicted ATPase